MFPSLSLSLCVRKQIQTKNFELERVNAPFVAMLDVGRFFKLFSIDFRSWLFSLD